MDVAAKFLANDLYAFLVLTSSAQQVEVKKKRLENKCSQGAPQLASELLIRLFFLGHRDE
jgi:hypothetical protein